MNLLFALSQIEVTGAETYAVTLAQSLRQMGHKVVFISDQLKNSLDFKFYSLPIHAQNSSYWGRLRNALEIRKILQEENIDLIHSHSRAANLVCEFARRSRLKFKIPMVVTVHGRWRNHFAARTLPCLGDQTLAICPYLERYLIDEIKRPANSIRMIPNGIDIESFIPMELASSTPTIVMLARFSGQKGKANRFLLRRVFPQMLEKMPQHQVFIAGNMAPKDDCDFALEFNQKLGRQAINIINEDVVPLEFYHTGSVAVGSGRVALEAMSAGKPVVAIGESSAPGLITPENFDAAFESNFGDCGEWNRFESKKDKLMLDLVRILTDHELRQNLGEWSRKKIKESFDSKGVAKNVLSLYTDLVTKSSAQ